MKFRILSILSDVSYAFLPILGYLVYMIVLIVILAYALLTSNIWLYLLIVLMIWPVIRYIEKQI